jgi:hypothetical protein
MIVLVGGIVQGTILTNPKECSQDELIGKQRTFLSGTIINPTENNGTVTASALQVFYFNPGIFVDQVGVVRGLSTISFTKGNFIMVWTPGPFELIGYVLGFCTDFEVQD